MRRNGDQPFDGFGVLSRRASTLALATTISGEVFGDAHVMEPIAQFSHSKEPRDFTGGMRDEIVDRPSKVFFGRGADRSALPLQATPGTTAG